MTDLYREQYKKETEQIHAPAALIARTKAAVREEEARILRESAAQAAEPEIKGLTKASRPMTAPGGSRSDVKGFSARKWAYPLTAAAALFILVSVSMTMRGLKSENRSAESTVYEESAVDMEADGMSGGADTDGGVAAGGITAEVDEPTEAAAEPFADEEASAEADLAAACASAGESEEMLESTAVTDALAEESTEAERSVQEEKESVKEMDVAREEAASAEDNAQTSGAVAEKITLEKVTDKPDFCENPDIETHVLEGETFQVVKIDNRWAAYVEIKDGGKYVLRGEAEDVETFLEAGYQKLLGVMSD